MWIEAGEAWYRYWGKSASVARMEVVGSFHTTGRALTSHDGCYLYVL